MLHKMLGFWLQNIYPRIAPLIATVGAVGLATCLLIVFVLAQLIDEVLEREAFAFDTTLLLWLHQFSNPILDRVMLTVTELGNPSVVVPVAAVSLVILWLQRYKPEAKILAIACLGGVVLNIGMKLAFSKPRPELWHRLITETSFSFPSGHALGSMVLYGFLGYLLAIHYPKHSPIIYALAALVIIAIGFSRLYLGVHWPTDVLAGYGIGFLWLRVCILMLQLQNTQRA
jgi:membrane-associated phospholipid phosphatase